MAQSGYTPIQLYYSTTASATPTAGNLAAGELAINTADEKLYFKNSSGTVKLLASSAGSSGSVTSVSVVSANGLAGTVANSTTTPAITLSTSITGILKGNGTAISAAASGADYAPATSGSSILSGNGAGGFSNVTVGSGLSFAGGTLTATGSGGTVTSVSVVSANGLAGTVATATTTPAITLRTTITGLLKGNGTAISAATSGTDYAPATSGSSLLSGNGAGGFTNVTTGTGVVTALGVNVGTAGAFVTNGGALGTPSSGTLTNATGLLIDGGTTGTLPVNRGGTGATTLTAGSVIVGNGTSAVNFVAPGSTGNVLTSNGTTWVSQAAGSTLVKISTATFNGTSGAIVSGMTSTYKSYIAVVSGLWALSGFVPFLEATYGSGTPITSFVYNYSSAAFKTTTTYASTTSSSANLSANVGGGGSSSGTPFQINIFIDGSYLSNSILTAQWSGFSTQSGLITGGVTVDYSGSAPSGGITGIYIFNPSITFSGGTVILYGLT